MVYRVKGARLYEGNRAVEEIASRFTGGRFAATPKILVMHFTYGGTGRSSAEWFRSPSNPGSSAHIVIDRDGSIIQCVDFDTIAWHAGASKWRNLNGLNRFSIGIEMANWGYLVRRNTGWVSYTGVAIADPVIASHKNGNPDGSTAPIGWEAYPESQFLAAVEVARALVDAYDINEIVGHDDIAPTRKWDPGPAFDLKRFRARVFGERSSDSGTRRVVSVAEGLNLRSGPATSFPVIRLLANGTSVSPHEQQGNWVMVSVLDANGTPIETGWVNQNFLD
jgi:N-acetylmuramoyl-L-alanine amidase